MTSTWDARPRPPFRDRRIRRGPVAPEAAHGPYGERPIPILRVVETPPPDEGLVAFRLGGVAVDADGLFALALFLPMLFLGNLQTMGAAMIAALTPLYLFVRRKGLAQTLWPRSFLFLVPAFALFSVLWSSAQRETLRFGAELAITVVAGLLLSSARNQSAVLKGLTLAFLTYVAAAIFFGGYVAVGVGMGGEAFSGLTESKNLLGDIASTGLIISAVVAIASLKDRRWVWFAIATAGVALDIYCVVGARSAGAMIGLALAIAAVLTLSPLVYAGRAMRSWVTGVVALLVVVIAASYSTLAQALMNLGATVFDKDPTLTGRTYLWYRAADLIREKPLLGRGYEAFWIQGNIDAEGLWRYFGIEDRGGFTFHNTFVEILVTLGWVGLLLIGATVVAGVIALMRRFVGRPSLPLVLWMAMLLYQLARTPIETIGIAPFYFSTALFFGALGAAFGETRAAARTARPHFRAPHERDGGDDPERTSAWANARPAPALRALRLVKSDEDGQ